MFWTMRYPPTRRCQIFLLLFGFAASSAVTTDALSSPSISGQQISLARRTTEQFQLKTHAASSELLSLLSNIDVGNADQDRDALKSTVSALETSFLNSLGWDYIREIKIWIVLIENPRLRFPSDLSIRLSGPKILIRFAIMAKSVPKKLVIRPKNTRDPIFLAQTFPAIQILLPGPPGSGEFPAGREIKFG
jgi:hypothetical protein